MANIAELMPRERFAAVVAVAERSSLASWERSTFAQAILELEAPELSPFSESFTLPAKGARDVPAQVLTQARWAIERRPTEADFPAGKGKILLADDSTGDPASFVTSLLLAEAAGETPTGEVGWREAVEKQLEYLKTHALKTEDGAVSHRVKELSLWADFMYMSPPSAAYYALVASSKADLTWAIEQCRLQRAYLRNETGLWKHIILRGDLEKRDPYCWATSNAWATAGMLRVIASIQRSSWAAEPDMQEAVQNLAGWVDEVLEAATSRAADSGMIRDYIDDEDSFEESCGTALLAYSAYRLAQLGFSQAHLVWAEQARQAVYERISFDGVLQDVCDIHDERLRRELSPEGQSFVILMEAAVRDWRVVSEAS